MNPVLCNAFPAFRPGDLILAIGEAVTDKLERRFRRRGRCCTSVVFELELEGPGEISMVLDERRCCVGVGVRLRSIGSPGVVGRIIGEEEGGGGVCALGLDKPWFGASRPEAKKLE
jgi:hypothetical protein